MFYVNVYLCICVWFAILDLKNRNSYLQFVCLERDFNSPPVWCCAGGCALQPWNTFASPTGFINEFLLLYSWECMRTTPLHPVLPLLVVTPCAIIQVCGCTWFYRSSILLYLGFQSFFDCMDLFAFSSICSCCRILCACSSGYPVTWRTYFPPRGLQVLDDHGWIAGSDGGGLHVHPSARIVSSQSVCRNCGSQGTHTTSWRWVLMSIFSCRNDCAVAPQFYMCYVSSRCFRFLPFLPRFAFVHLPVAIHVVFCSFLCVYGDIKSKVPME